ncbi:hypothetical protein BTVI_59453 [Pitangus sulphuratus]|nr:hypothetical protein BTVI_59453 [Pitangus sulphuratus]
MPDYPLCKEFIPDIQPKPLLAELKTMPSFLTDSCLGEETNPHLATTSFQVLDKLSRGETTLDLALTNADELIKKVKIGGCLGCSDHALDNFVVSRNRGLAKNKVRTMNFRKLNFQMFKEIVDDVQVA